MDSVLKNCPMLDEFREYGLANGKHLDGSALVLIWGKEKGLTYGYDNHNELADIKKGMDRDAEKCPCPNHCRLPGLISRAMTKPPAGHCWVVGLTTKGLREPFVCLFEWEPTDKIGQESCVCHKFPCAGCHT